MSPPVYRAHRRGNGVWFFSSDGGGRFDLADGRGTCYLASSVASAVRERLGEQFANGRAIAPEDARTMVVSSLPLTVERVADLESPEVANYPITIELTAMDDYAIPQAWASAFDQAGFRGIRYRGRFSYVTGDSWAIFGKAGPTEALPGDTSPLDGFEACARAGVPVLPEPPSSEVGLTIESAPPAE